MKSITIGLINYNDKCEYNKQTNNGDFESVNNETLVDKNAITRSSKISKSFKTSSMIFINR